MTLPQIWPASVAAFIIALIAQVIGMHTFDLGPAAIVFFPMVWGLLMGAAISFQKFRPVGLDFQRVANAFVGVAVLFLIARLAFNIGPNLPLLLDAGPALLLQEVGHLLGTIALALPLAVLLRMGKATVGATFSLDREPAFAMVSEKYGPDSDQYRGVLAMYVFGTLFGAIYVSLLTSVISSLNFFDPLAMAMGAGVGSGSMMAASVGSIIAAHPDQESAILSIAAVSNLITTVLGVYVGIYIALPLADRFYRVLTRRQSRRDEAAATATAASTVHSAADTAGVETNRAFRAQVLASSAPISIRPWTSIPILAVVGVTTASVFAGGLSLQILGGYAVLIALLLLGMLLAKVSRKVSSIVWVTTLGAVISSPWSPIGTQLVALVASVDFLSIACVTLTFAGLSLGKDLPLLKTVGWKIIPVGLVAITASFLLSTLIAEFALGFWG
ncbi:DUF3100 domain-containing protein [Cryobacterium melibiosiphilum]|uniref:DUF3100 domain-containing protein n=1 Tax=Cryobacterium melibiosiphilum TaxID=995039 RepID=A0A3A5M935_9MICO|nr:DUF3100 domain-containing protein [Cryobacterium melibiosiphilum]RJT85761.1 DUF3100 domain-containing protein [Cryobacterium melibiosiphilum]